MSRARLLRSLQVGRVEPERTLPLPPLVQSPDLLLHPDRSQLPPVHALLQPDPLPSAGESVLRPRSSSRCRPAGEFARRVAPARVRPTFARLRPLRTETPIRSTPGGGSIPPQPRALAAYAHRECTPTGLKLLAGRGLVSTLLPSSDMTPRHRSTRAGDQEGAPRQGPTGTDRHRPRYRRNGA